MAANNKSLIVSPEVKELVVCNFQSTFPAITDRNKILRVLTKENWDMEKSFHIIKKLNEELKQINKKKQQQQQFPPNVGLIGGLGSDNIPSVEKKKRSRTRKIKTKLQITDKDQHQLINDKITPSSSTKMFKLIKQPINSPNKSNQGKNDSTNDTNTKIQERQVAKIKMKQDLKRSFDTVKQLRDPFDRIVAYSKSKIRVMVFMRGCAGSGKSTYAKQVLKMVGITNPKANIFSADDFFIEETNTLTSAYVYNSDLLHNAHEWNRKLIKQACIEGRNPIIIDNTHTKLWEMKDNAMLGVEYGYIIETLEPKTPWRFDENMLYKKTLHTVTKESIRRMLDRYEPELTGKDVTNLLGLLYKKPPPHIQSVNYTNLPPSKKMLKLYLTKNEIKLQYQKHLADCLKQNTNQIPSTSIQQQNLNNSQKLTDINFKTNENNLQNLSTIKSDIPMNIPPLPNTSFENKLKLASLSSSSDDEEVVFEDEDDDDEVVDDEGDSTDSDDSESSVKSFKLEELSKINIKNNTNTENINHKTDDKNVTSNNDSIQQLLDENIKKPDSFKLEELNGIIDSFKDNPQANVNATTVLKYILDKLIKNDEEKEQKNETVLENIELNKKPTFNEASSNTNYTDFETLKKVNKDNVLIENRDDILIGRPVFKSAPLNKQIEKKLQSKYMLDKSSMTCDIQTNLIKDGNIGINYLSKLFPKLKRESLEELFVTCNKDIDWAVEILLDSGFEMSEYSIPEIVQQEQLSSTNDIDIPIKQNKDNTTVGTDVNVKQADDIKKKKRSSRKISGNNLELIQNVQDKFKLNEECYSETVSKIRKQRMPQQNADNDEQKVQQQQDIEKAIENVVMNEETPEEDEAEEDEGEVSLTLDKDVINQLQNKFGGLLSPSLICDKTVIQIPKTLARQLYSYAFDSICKHLEKQQDLIDSLINEAKFKESPEEEPVKAQPSLQEIMDYELALRMKQIKDNKPITAASVLSRKLLVERFPNFSPETLASIFEDTNHSLYEATNLLKLAGHSVSSENKTEPSTSKKEETPPLSRDEAIDQAQAYSDVAGKIYELRKDCLEKAEEALKKGNKTVAMYYAEMAKWHMERIEQSNSLAASAMLTGHEGATTLDLHFLHLQQAIKILDLFLDEKIRELKGRKTVVYIITGRGAHSPNGICKIKQAVQSRLYKRHIQFLEQNPGLLRAFITKRSVTSYNQLKSTK